MQAWRVFREFFLLGWISFGGPAAHVGYFHRRFVTSLGGLEEYEFTRRFALSKLLPGPPSSQLGFAIGRHRPRLHAPAAALVGFTMQ